MNIYDIDGNIIPFSGGGEGGGEYKDPDPTIVTLTPAATKSGVRVVSGAEQANSSYNTYLFAFSDFPEGIVALLSTFTTGPSYYGGYTESGGTYTYTNVGVDPYAPGVSTTYDGFYISTNKSMTFTYYAGIPVVTRYGYPHPTQKGFRSIEHDEIPFALASQNAGAYFRITGFEDDNAYIVDLGNVAPTGFHEKTTTSKTHPAYLNLTGKQYLFGNLAKAPMQFEVRQGQQAANMRALCERGIYLWELLDIDELVAARSNIPNICLIHQGNWMDQVLFCMAQGWSGIECDVRTTSDGVCIFSHDATISGLTIASSTYADLVAANPSVTTVDEMMQIVGRFRGWIDFHWQAVDDATKLVHIKKAIGYKCANVMYYQGSNGTYIGDSIPIADFWKTGACHVSGHGANDLDHANAYLNIDNGINWRGIELGSGVTITYVNLTTTYADRNIIFAYFHTPCLYQS